MTDATIGCPLITPFDEDGDLDLDALATLAESVCANGIDTLVPCGTTGEFAALTAAECDAVIETIAQAAPADVDVVAGASATAVEDVRARIDAAAAAGADGALLTPPYYQTASEPAGNERFFERAVADSPLPVTLYNIPSLVGGSIAVETLVSLAERDLITGLKDSSGDLAYLGSVLGQTDDDFTVLQGFDAGFVPALVLGADGGTNALTNVMPDAFRRAAGAVASGDVTTAREIQIGTIDPVFESCVENGFTTTAKAILAAQGGIPTGTVRPPLSELDDGTTRDLVARMP